MRVDIIRWHLPLLVIIGSALFSLINAAPRHHSHPHKSQQLVNSKLEKSTENKLASRSYIDIDASDPFKVPKGSHYIDQTLPNFDEEAGARATVENNEESPSPDDEGNRDEQTDIENQNAAVNFSSEGEKSMEDAPGSSQENVSDDIPDSVKEKIKDLTMDTKDGKPIEINEKDLNNMLKKEDSNEGSE